MSSSAWQNKPGTGRILTKKNLAGWHRANTSTTAGEAEPKFGHLPESRATYDARIDRLFGGAKAKAGTRVLDRSNLMGLPGHENAPPVLSESHLLGNRSGHPEMTAERWKRVSEWIDHPAAAYNSGDRIVLIGPKTIAGYPVRR